MKLPKVTKTTETYQRRTNAVPTPYQGRSLRYGEDKGRKFGGFRIGDW